MEFPEKILEDEERPESIFNHALLNWLETVPQEKLEPFSSSTASVATAGDSKITTKELEFLTVELSWKSSALVNITYNNNLITASPGGYCLAAGHNPGKPYGSNPTNITVTNNIFQRGSSGKCASFGPVTSFLSANGNVWSNNKYADGMAIPAAD